MILTGPEIKKRIDMGQIVIDPYDERKINPNSYNVTLHNELLQYSSTLLDMKKDNPTERIIIPEDGFVIRPGEFYLGRTAERTITNGLVPVLEGRSSIGRLSISIHATANFGDNGFDGYWTLQITTIIPIRIYAGVDIGQIYYQPTLGEELKYTSKKYQRNMDIESSKLYMDFKK